jgi:fumarate reductase subunit D
MVVSLYVQSFMDKFSLKLVFFSLFFTLHYLWHTIANLKLTPIDNWTIDGWKHGKVYNSITLAIHLSS